MIQEKEYMLRRELFAQKMAQFSVAIIGSSSTQTRSNDTEYPFRQDSNLYYLCGFKEENASLVFVKKRKKTEVYMFVQKKDKRLELWTGSRLGIAKAKEKFHVDDVFCSDAFDTKIKEWMSAKGVLYYDFNQSDARVKKLVKHFLTCKNIAPIIGKMRLIKSDAEIQLIKKAIAITKETHHKAMTLSGKLDFEYELQAEIEYAFKKNGAYSDAYTSIVACGNSANTLHYVNNDKKLVKGELILIDAGCEYEYYASDITRTIPVSGRYSDAQKELYDMVLDVQLKIIEMIQPGILRSKLHQASEKLLCEGMVKLGILKGDVKKLLKKAKHKKYYPHGIGHWMGLDVHDASPYKDKKNKEIKLQEGMVLTIEPAIYCKKDDTKIPKKFRGIGIRIEDDILVTKEGYENLSASIAKTTQEIENLS